MLTQMDGAEGLEGVYVLAATSRPDLIDPALLRPGRLDKSLLCDMPDHRDRREVCAAAPVMLSSLITLAFQILIAASRKIALAEDIDFDHYASVTEGYSGADLQAVMYNAHLDCIQASIVSPDEPTHSEGTSGKASLAPTWTRFGGFGNGKGKNGTALLSRAEEAVFERTVSALPCLGLDHR